MGIHASSRTAAHRLAVEVLDNQTTLAHSLGVQVVEVALAALVLELLLTLRRLVPPARQTILSEGRGDETVPYHPDVQ